MRFHVVVCCLIVALVSPCLAVTRHYYIAAEDVDWNYAPSGQDLIHGSPLPLTWSQKTHWPKSRFVGYTDESFSTRQPQPEWLGILGPIIRAEVGDEIFVHFFNRTHGMHNIHPHGLRYDKDNEGGFYVPRGKGGRVPPGGKFTYHWFADKDSGPGPGQLSSVVWWYHPHVDEGSETNQGLLGPIIVTAKGKAKPDGSPADVDDEFVASFMIFDELAGKKEGMFYAINGYIFGNLPGLTMKKNDHVRWYLLGMGNEKDIHTPHWHGKTVTDGHRNTDVIELLPASMTAVDMLADNPGSWLFHCQVADHMEAGMSAIFTIYPAATRSCPIQFQAGDFWGNPNKINLTYKNTSGKEIDNAVLRHEHLLSPQYLRQPFDADWTVDKAMKPGDEQTIEKPAYQSASSQSITGWAFFPYLIKFKDGSTWQPQSEGECFHVFWRDNGHPELPVLPPRQVELNED